MREMNVLYPALLMILGLALIPVIYQLFFVKRSNHEDETDKPTRPDKPFRTNLPSALRSANRGRHQRDAQGLASEGRQPDSVSPERPDPLLRPDDGCGARTQSGTETDQDKTHKNHQKEMT